MVAASKRKTNHIAELLNHLEDAEPRKQWSDASRGVQKQVRCVWMARADFPVGSLLTPSDNAWNSTLIYADYMLH